MVPAAEAVAAETTATLTRGATGTLMRAEGGGGAAVQAGETLARPVAGLKRTREEVLQKFRELHPPERTRLLESMPEELQKYHGELCKIAPGHLSL